MRWGPNWEDSLGGAPEHATADPVHDLEGIATACSLDTDGGPGMGGAVGGGTTGTGNTGGGTDLFVWRDEERLDGMFPHPAAEGKAR
ncbi:hypothetical protein ACIQMJ_39355 [Actinosynnema sp. NPDC091369]